MIAPAPRRALLVTKTDPATPRDGGTLRVAAVIDALAADGWTIDVVAARRSDGGRRHDVPSMRGGHSVRAAAQAAIRAARIGSVSVARWVDPRIAARIATLRGRRRYDLAVVEFSQLLVYRDLLAGLPVLLDLHNLEAELLANYGASARSRARRTAARWETARVARLEGAASLGRVAAITTVSGRDTERVRTLLPGARIATAPNGVGDAAFAVDKAPAASPVVVFVAHLGWQPNVDAVQWLVALVWPLVRAARPDARLHLVGRSPADEVRALHGRDGVEVHADVESTLPYLAAASVATAPLQAAGGTRLKILEAVATGTPVVATPLGAMGLEHLAGAPLDIAADPAAFADAVVRRCADPGDAAAIRAAAEPYRWQRVLEPLVGLADAAARGEDRA